MNKIVLVLAILFVIHSASAQSTFKWTSCGAATDDFTINALSIIPDPPVRGQNTSVIANGTMASTVTAGTSTLTIKFGPIVVLKQVQSVCTAPVTCPIPAGAFNSPLPPVLVPADSPDGIYNGNVVITDQSSKEIACVNYSFKISS